VPDPTIESPLDVIVKIGAAGLCRTDIHIQQGWFADAHREAGLQLPYAPGHENAGWVEEVGSAVTHVAPGDPVILHPLQTCGLCRACRAGQDMHCDFGVFNGLLAPGGFAQYMRTNARTVIKLAPHLQPTDVAALADAGLTAYHAVKKPIPLLYPGTRALVIGAGGLGHIGIQCLLAMSPTEIIVLDRNEGALKLAKELGAHHVVQTKKDGSTCRRSATSPTARELRSSSTSSGRRAPPPTGSPCSARPGRTSSSLAELMVLTAQGQVSLHTQTYDLADVNTAIADLENGSLVGRGILVP
jgi:NAD+-dependent secondary alcohol dehydrogenase Adh1